jgi:hypothetical protein
MKKYLLLFALLYIAGCSGKKPPVNIDEKKLCDRIMEMNSEFDSVFVKTKEIEINPGEENAFGFLRKTIIRNNNIYIATGLPNTMMVFNPEGKLIRKIGRLGSGPGEFKIVRDFDVDDKGNIYVLDTPNGRVSVFTDNNVFLNSFPAKICSNICADNKGGYFLYNSGADIKSDVNVIAHYNKGGEVIKEFCPVFSHAQVMGGTIFRGFDDNIYISNVSTYLAKKYDFDGKLLGEYKDVSTIFKELDVKGRMPAQEELLAIHSLTGMAVTNNNLVILEYYRPEPKGQWNDIYYTDGTLLKRGIKTDAKLRLRVIANDENLYYVKEPETGQDYNFKIVGYKIRGSK